MAPPADQGTGDRDDNPWMQPVNGLWVPEDDTPVFTNSYVMQAEAGLWNPEDNVNFNDIFTNPYMTQAENSLWNPEDNVNFNDIFTNMFMMQAAVGRDGTARTSSNHIDCLVANGSDSKDYTDANIPRGEGAMEQIQALVTPPFQVADNNIEPQHLPGNTILADKGQDEPQYVTHARNPHVTKRTRKNSGLSSEEWQKWKPEIHSLYVDDNYTLEVTRAKMAKKGFHAEASMYKRRIRDWGWRTYELDKHSGNSGGEPSIGKSGKRTRGKVLGSPSTLQEENCQSNSSRGPTGAASTFPHLGHIHSNSTHSSNTHFTPSYLYPAHFTSTHFNPSALREETSQSNSSTGTTVAVFTSPRLTYTHFNPTHFSMGIPAPMSNTEFDGLLSTILAKVKDLYTSYPAQNKWKVEKQREVEEDIHDDLLVGVAASLRNYSLLSPAVGYIGFQKALHTLEKVVGVGEGADCGLFSLPAIWVSFLHMVRNQRSDWAREFLSLALKLAINKLGREHPFVQVLLNLQKVWAKEPGQLEEVVFKAYRRCIADVKEELGAFNLTYLSLWGDYVVYLDGRSTNETQAVVSDIRSVIKISEEEKGPDGGPDGDYTLELLGLTLYVLQSAPTMADEAEKVAMDLLVRVNQRRVKDGGTLEGNLFITWKDLRHTLGTFCQEKKDYHQAIGYLEYFLSHEIVDERDALALEKLEGCYLSLGRHDDAKKVWKWRMDSSQRLLQKTETEPVEGEKVVNDHGERDDDDGGDVSEEEESCEATAVHQVEESNQENFEENIANELGDSEVEIQLLQEQIAELKQRLKCFEAGKKKGGKIVSQEAKDCA